MKSETSETDDRIDRNKWRAMMGIGLGIFMATIDTSIVNISLPTLVQQLHTDFATVQWVVVSYVLMLASFMLTVARLGDMKGKKRVYMVGLALFTLASLLCGLSAGVHWLIAFRGLQGLGGSMMQAVGLAIITEIFPSSERGRALGIIGGIVSVGLALGPPLGGLLIGLAGWRSIFLVNVPLGMITALVVGRYVHSRAVPEVSQRFDMAGALVLLVTLMCYALGMTLGQRLHFSDLRVLMLLGLSAAGLGLFIAVELRVYQPMIELRLFKNMLFSLNLVMGFLCFVANAGIVVIPFFLQLVMGYGTEQVGMLLMVIPLGMGLAAPWAGMLSDRFGSRGISLLGLVVVVGGCLAISSIHPGLGMMGLVIRMLPLGIGTGMFQSPNNSAIMGAVPRHHLGVASGLLSLSRTLGNTSGIPLIGAIFTAIVLDGANPGRGLDVGSAPASALVRGISGTFHISAWIIGGAVVLSALALWVDRRRRSGSRHPA